MFVKPALKIGKKSKLLQKEFNSTALATLHAFGGLKNNFIFSSNLVINFEGLQLEFDVLLKLLKILAYKSVKHRKTLSYL